MEKSQTLLKTVPSIELRLLISLIPGNGMIHYFQKQHAPENLFSALWMIR